MAIEFSPVAAGSDEKVIGSTAEVDARDNTSTDPTVETGCAIFLLDGSTLIANDYADLWDGAIQNPIGITEQGTAWTFWPWTGTEIKGLCARGGFEVDIEWKKGTIIKVVIKSKVGKMCKVRYREKTIEFKTAKGSSHIPNDLLEII